MKVSLAWQKRSLWWAERGVEWWAGCHGPDFLHPTPLPSFWWGLCSLTPACFLPCMTWLTPVVAMMMGLYWYLWLRGRVDLLWLSDVLCFLERHSCLSYHNWIELLSGGKTYLTEDSHCGCGTWGRNKFKTLHAWPWVTRVGIVLPFSVMIFLLLWQYIESDKILSSPDCSWSVLALQVVLWERGGFATSDLTAFSPFSYVPSFLLSLLL